MTQRDDGFTEHMEPPGARTRDTHEHALDTQPDSQRERVAAAKWTVTRVVMEPNTWEALLNATRQPLECGGLLFGDRLEATQTVRIFGYLIPSQHRATSAFCEFDMRWVGLLRAALMSADLDEHVFVVAWIHTHPHLSVFLSGTDVNTIDYLQQLNPMVLAVVLDPFSEDIGAFHMQRRQRDAAIALEAIQLAPSVTARLQTLSSSPLFQEAAGFHVLTSASDAKAHRRKKGWRRSWKRMDSAPRARPREQ